MISHQLILILKEIDKIGSNRLTVFGFAEDRSGGLVGFTRSGFVLCANTEEVLLSLLQSTNYVKTQICAIISRLKGGTISVNYGRPTRGLGVLATDAGSLGPVSTGCGLELNHITGDLSVTGLARLSPCQGHALSVNICSLKVTGGTRRN